ncbi:MAG: bifunctional riboflavin kinase/FAD synthetase [Clostridia bacterium]|nr:bifunctional riboflavin kinase/FAD synthetase [Clostridia bacterium]
MKSYTTKNFRAASPTVVALGCFDGVHRGHAAVIAEAVKIARERSLPCAVFTFREPPRNYFTPNAAPLITDYREKQRLMRALGVDIFVCVRFDAEIGSLSPEAFFEEILLGRLNASHLVCGFNYSFGKGGRGDTALMRHLCEKSQIGLSCVPSVNDGNITVSSSAIRQAVESGDMELAGRYLGRHFSLCAPIVGGQRLARKLGFPTINQVFEKNILIPRRGVYVTRIAVGRRNMFGITNVGIRPTVDDHTLCAESHIFDFEGDLYGKTVRVEFLKYLRPEREFSSIVALSEQVQHDIAEAKNFITQTK